MRPLLDVGVNVNMVLGVYGVCGELGLACLFESVGWSTRDGVDIDGVVCWKDRFLPFGVCTPRVSGCNVCGGGTTRLLDLVTRPTVCDCGVAVPPGQGVETLEVNDSDINVDS